MRSTIAAFWSAFVAALRDVGYDGVLSIENEDASLAPEASVEQGAAFMRGILERSADRSEVAGPPLARREQVAVRGQELRGGIDQPVDIGLGVGARQEAADHVVRVDVDARARAASRGRPAGSDGPCPSRTARSRGTAGWAASVKYIVQTPADSRTWTRAPVSSIAAWIPSVSRRPEGADVAVDGAFAHDPRHLQRDRDVEGVPGERPREQDVALGAEPVHDVAPTAQHRDREAVADAPCPSVVRSGVTPNRSWAPPGACRNPVMTSSKIRTTPASVQAARIVSRKPWLGQDDAGVVEDRLEDDGGDRIALARQRVADTRGVVVLADHDEIADERGDPGRRGDRRRLLAVGREVMAPRHVVVPAVVVALELEDPLATGERAGEPDRVDTSPPCRCS